jgi:hypothetical protein
VKDLLAILERLLQQQVEFVLVGGQAAIAHGATLVTRDVDVCMSFAPANLARLEAALDGLHPVHRMLPQAQPFQVADFEPGSLKNLYLRTDWGVLDCLGQITGLGGYETVAARSVTIDLPIGRCRVLSLPALIEAKAAMDRVQDKLALIQLKAIHDGPKN